MEYHQNFRSRNNKKNRKWFLIFLIGTILFYWWYQNSRYNYLISTAINPGNPNNIAVIIAKGDNPDIIGQNLEKKELILNADSFKKYIKNEQLDTKIIAGRFQLNQTMTIPQIVKKITDKSQGQTVLTVQEGSTIPDIDQKLADLGLIQKGEFITSTGNFNNYTKYSFLDQQKISKLPHPLEGYLFPDTYFLDANTFSPEYLIDYMLKNFQKKMPPELFMIDQNNERSLYDTVIMASIIEKEVRTSKDLPIVSGILWKRLEENWQIGADATLLYLKNDRTINQNDLNADSAYNTRKNVGLIPGPICNPGLKSMLAALHPEKSAYYYYLTTADGEVIYAHTNDEQNQNKAKYL